MATALRLAAVAVWAAFVWAMTAWGESGAALLAAVVATFALGGIVGRWWVLLAVLIPGLGLAAMSALDGTESDDGHGSGLDWALWFFVPLTVAAALVLALGVGCHRLAATRRRPVARSQR